MTFLSESATGVSPLPPDLGGQAGGEGEGAAGAV
jgi:hypothetical protein